MSSLEGKIALVTGAGIGIGQGIAIELARQGAKVAVHYAGSADGAQFTLSQIESAGGEGVIIQGDLAQVDECRRVVDEAASQLGGLDIMVNNSGVTRTFPFLETTEETYNEVFDINMRGMFFCSQQAVPYILERGGGSILNLTSVHGFGGFPNHSAYAATKGAIISFTRQLAVELAPQHIRVNAIGPGLIEVPRYFDNPDYTSEQGAQKVPWGRVGKPHDIATTAAFLVSEAADFITGQVLYVDGGATARM
jgi:NAD(P)-dependent dehydrogenase (short-subunit alcohol dehydrogenase family)